MTWPHIAFEPSGVLCCICQFLVPWPGFTIHGEEACHCPVLPPWFFSDFLGGVAAIVTRHTTCGVVAVNMLTSVWSMPPPPGQWYSRDHMGAWQRYILQLGTRHCSLELHLRFSIMHHHSLFPFKRATPRDPCDTWIYNHVFSMWTYIYTHECTLMDWLMHYSSRFHLHMNCHPGRSLDLYHGQKTKIGYDTFIVARGNGPFEMCCLRTKTTLFD